MFVPECSTLVCGLQQMKTWKRRAVVPHVRVETPTKEVGEELTIIKTTFSDIYLISFVLSNPE